MTDARPRTITGSTVKNVFHTAYREAARGSGRPLPPEIDFEKIAVEISRPWVEGFKHGAWELKLAIQVVLDDGPRAADAERRHKSVEARQRSEAYSRLVEAAQELVAAGLSLPTVGDRRPITKQARAVANPDHRDWRAVFSVVERQIRDEKSRRPVGITEDSLAIEITYQLLYSLGFEEVTHTGLSQMLKRGRAARTEQFYDKAVTEHKKDK